MFCPESPRWLIQKGRDEQALKTLAHYHADGNRDDPLVQYEYEEIRASVELDKQFKDQVGYKTLFATPGNRKRMITIIGIGFFSQWSGNGLVSYYLNKVFDAVHITDPTTQLLINGILQIWNLGWALMASFMCERFGRRTLFLTSVAGMSVFWMMQTVCFSQVQMHDDKQASHAVIAAIFLYYAAYDLAFTPLIVTYTVEIMPLNIRAKAFNVFNLVISLSLIFNQYANPIALDALGWKYYLVYQAWLIFEGAFLWYFVIETRGRTLEETAVLFDGEEVSEDISGKAAHTGAIDTTPDEKSSGDGHEAPALTKV
jgi:MFS family permease